MPVQVPLQDTGLDGRPARHTRDPSVLEVDGDGMAGEIGPIHQYVLVEGDVKVDNIVIDVHIESEVHLVCVLGSVALLTRSPVLRRFRDAETGRTVLLLRGQLGERAEMGWRHTLSFRASEPLYTHRLQ